MRTYVLTALLTATILFGFLFIHRGFPPVNSDEAFLANHAWNLMQTGSNRYSLYDDLFEPTLTRYREAQAGLLQIVFEAWIGPSLTLLPKSLANARLSSWLAGFLFLMALFAIGKGTTSGHRTCGVWCLVLAATHPVFLTATSLVRAEVVTVMAFTATLLLGLRLSDDKVWKYPLLGWLMGLQIGIHQNSMPLFIGALAFFAIRGTAPSVGLRSVYLVLSYGAGLLTITGLIDRPSFILSQQSGIYELYKPPILTWPWDIVGWAGHWFSLLYNGQPSWYLRGDLGALWPAALRIHWGAGLLSLILSWTLIRRQTPDTQRKALSWLAGLAATFVALCLLVRKTEVLYTVTYLPFWIPLIVMSVNDFEMKPMVRRGLQTLLLLCSIAALLLFSRFAFRYQTQYRPYAAIVQDVRSVTTPSDRVAAPAVLWFAWPDSHFRDISALVGSRWMTGGRRDVSRWLQGWKPDVVVIDEGWKRMLLGREGETFVLLQKSVPEARVTFLKRIATGAASEGDWEIYRMQWTKSE